MSEPPETLKSAPSAWMPPAEDVKARLLTKVDGLGVILPGAALILPTLRGKLRGLSEADVHGLLVYLDDLVAELWGDVGAGDADA